jgi:hypothetical protein
MEKGGRLLNHAEASISLAGKEEHCLVVIDP